MRGGQCLAVNLMDARFGWTTQSLGGHTRELLVNTLVCGGPAGEEEEEEGEALTAVEKVPLPAAAEGRTRLPGTGSRPDRRHRSASGNAKVDG